MKTILSRSCFAAILLIVILAGSCTRNESTNHNYDVYNQYELDKAIVQILTTNLATGLETIFSQDRYDSTEMAHMCQAIINPVRFFDDKSGYFFVESNDAWSIATPIQPEVIRTYRYNIQDAYGKYYVRDMVNTIKYTGYGFVEYHYDNPVSGEYERKLGFVKSIPSAGFWAGAGFFGDPELYYYDQEEAMKIIVKEASIATGEGLAGIFSEIYSDSLQRVQFCRDFIDHIRFFDDQSGYFFIYDFNNICVAHALQKDLEGKDLSDWQDSRGKYVSRDAVAIASGPGSGYFDYYWNNPETGKEEKKISYIVKIPGIDYLIGTGFY